MLFYLAFSFNIYPKVLDMGVNLGREVGIGLALCKISLIGIHNFVILNVFIKNFKSCAVGSTVACNLAVCNSVLSLKHKVNVLLCVFLVFTALKHAESINKTVRALKNSAPPVRAESDSEITVMLKNSLKPSRIPENENYKFTAEILTATEVGGNLCDIFQIDKEHVGMFFADVMEKGVSQGLYMMKAKNLLRKALLKNTPEKALHLVNEELCKNGGTHIPLKAFLGILNLRTAVLLTFNAGHVDPLIKSPNGKTSFVTGPFNPLLGDASSSVFVPFSLQLNAGDRLYFYSSDTIELANAKGEKFGRERFLNIISSSGSNAQEIVNAILSDVKEFSGKSSPEAEIAIAVLEYTPVTAGN